MRNTCLATKIAGFVLVHGLLNANPQRAQTTPAPLDALGPKIHAGAGLSELAPILPADADDTLGRVRYWNKTAVDASGLDHTHPLPGETRVFGEQFGPTRASRAMAIVHIAMFDAFNAIAGGFESYTHQPRVLVAASKEAAVAQAAHDSLVALFPSQASSFDERLAADLAMIRNGPAKRLGKVVGQRAAAAILALRASDGSARPEPKVGVDYFFSPDLAQWQQDPVSRAGIALGAHWGEVRPFVMTSASHSVCFTTAGRRAPPPLTTGEAQGAMEGHADRAHDGAVRHRHLLGVRRNSEPVCTAAALNRVAMQIASARHPMRTTPASPRVASHLAGRRRNRRLGVKISLQRLPPSDRHPPDARRRGLAPTRRSCRSARRRQFDRPNFTPFRPTSGHAGALFETLRRFYGTDHIAFTFVSDELNGVTRDHDGNIRPLLPRSFTSLSEAEEENGQSRIYLGIHWSFDKTEGIAQGRRVADYVFAHAFRRVHN